MIIEKVEYELVDRSISLIPINWHISTNPKLFMIVQKKTTGKKPEISNHGWMCKWTLTDHTVENYYTLRRDEILINTIIWMNCENIHVSNRIFTQEWCAVVTHGNFAHMKLTYSRKKHQKNDGLWELGTEIYWIGIWQFSGWYPLFW